MLAVTVALAAIAWFMTLGHAPLQVSLGGSRGTIVIGSDDSTFGGDAEFGRPIQLGEAFAVGRVGSVRGYALKFVTYDDTRTGFYDPQIGAGNIQSMLANPRLLAEIGPSHANVAAAMTRIANPASLAVISPVTTWPCLTVEVGCANGEPTAASMRPTGVNNYFRIAALNTESGAAMADFAYDRLGLRAIAAWDDEVALDAAATDRFTAEFTKKGGKVVARQGFDLSKGKPDFRPWLRQAKLEGAEAIYTADLGTDFCAARGQSQGIFDSSSYYLAYGDGYDVGYAGGTSLRANTAECIRDAGQMANDHIYVTLGVGAAELNPDAQAAVAAYKAAHTDPESTSVGTFAGYDCAMIVIDAIARAIDARHGAMPTRQEVLKELAQTKNFHGLTGTFTFDAVGDSTTPTVQVVQNEGGSWMPVANRVVPKPLAG